MYATTFPEKRQALLLKLLAGSVCISFSPVFIKLADVSPDTAGFYRMLFAAASLLLWLRLRKGEFQVPHRPRLLLVLGGVLLGVDFMCWHRSIDLVGPGLSTLLGNFQVFFTALFSLLIFKLKVSRLFLVAVVLALAGLLLITGVDVTSLDSGYQLGIVFGLGTAVFYSGYVLLVKQAMERSAFSGAAAILIVSTSCMFFMATATLMTGASFQIPDLTSLGSLIAVGVICTTLGWSLISSALKETPATLASLVLLLQPALAFVWDVLLFSRPTAGIEVLGIVLILVGIYLGSLRRGSD